MGIFSVSSAPYRVRMGGAVANVVVLCSLLTVYLCVGQEQTPNLPVLFSFSQPSHNVAVFRGADLTRAIASGAVKGFGNPAHGGLGLAGHGHGAGHALAHAVAPVVTRPVVQRVARPVVSQAVYRPVARPVVAPVQRVAPVVPYVDPYYSEDAHYAYQYSVLDDLVGTNFADHEARDGPHTEGQYSVHLPDGRLQTVTYTVDGNSGYVADVQYS